MIFSLRRAALSLSRLAVCLAATLSAGACGESTGGLDNSEVPSAAGLDDAEVPDGAGRVDVPGNSEVLDMPTEADPFAPTTTALHFEVDYVEGAEPYAGTVGRFADVWAITRGNLATLFPTHAAQIPSSLQEMQRLAPTGTTRYSVARILEMAAEHWDHPATAKEARYYLLWLDGWFENAGEIDHSVLGVSIGGSRVVAMFKPVIDASARRNNDTVPAFVEQATLVHEFGHAIGLVNRGVELTNDHHDLDNGPHCTNRDCVMYHLNEGVLDLRAFVSDFFETGEVNLFGDDCLADVAAAFD